MNQVWMCQPDGEPELVPFEAKEIATRHTDGWRQCSPPQEKPIEPSVEVPVEESEKPADQIVAEQEHQ